MGKENFSFEKEMENQEKNAGKVTSAAVAKAKEKMENDKLEQDAKAVENRLKQAERDKEAAARDGRYASKKKNILKKFSEGLNEAKEKFETDGDWKAYDKTIEKLKSEKREAIEDAKKDVYGDDAWSIRD